MNEVNRELILTNVSRRYGNVVAVQDVSFSVAHGEIVAVLGPSGSGKTTVLNMVGGQLQPSSGDIRIGGKSIAGLPPEKIDAATVFQDYALFPHLNVLDNVGFGPRMRSVSRSEAAKKAMECLSLVGLSEYGDRKVTQLSGGQRQRVATARALAVEPAILLMDEPLGALDRQIRLRLQDELSALLRRLEVTTLLVTHDQTEAFAMADRIAVMHNGRLEQIGSPDELYSWPRTEFVSTFLGGGTILEARAAQRSSHGSVRAETVIGSFNCRVNCDVPEGASLRVLVRPEHVSLQPAGTSEVSDLKNGQVANVLNNGEATRTTVRFGDVTIESLQLGWRQMAQGDAIDALIKRDGPVVIVKEG